VLTREITTSNNEMYLLDFGSGEIKHISAHEGDATYSPADFSLDNQCLYYLTNEGDEFTYLTSYNLESGKKEVAFKSDWDVWYAYFSFHEKYQVIGINQDAKTVVKVFETATSGTGILPVFPFPGPRSCFAWLLPVPPLRVISIFTNSGEKDSPA
jgi:hypothetical protein